MNHTATITAAGLLTGLTMLSACSTARSGTAAPVASSSKPAPTTTKSVAPTLPVAANGTDLAACGSGSCEVTVTGPVSIPAASAFGVGSVAVTAIGTGTVKVSVTFPAAGTSNFDCTAPTCDGGFEGAAAGQDYGTGFATLEVTGTFTVNHLELQAVAVLGGSAVLRLSRN